MALFLKPNPNKVVNDEPLRVYDPQRKCWMPAAGYAVPADAYWVRRLADGDCVEFKPGAEVAAVEEAAPEPEAPKPTKTTAKKGK